MLDEVFKSNHIGNIQRENHHPRVSRDQRVPIDLTHESYDSVKSLIPQKPTNDSFPEWAIRDDNCICLFDGI
jgi:hypothetical protein